MEARTSPPEPFDASIPRVISEIAGEVPGEVPAEISAETSRDAPRGALSDVPRAEDLLAAGRWRAQPISAPSSGGGAGEPAPLAFVPVPPLRERIRRGASVPALAGAAVFVLAVVIAILMTVFRGGVDVSSVAEAKGSTAASGKEGAGTESGEAASGADRGGADRGGAGSEAAGSQASGSRVFVHVVGEVKRAGVVKLAANARVSDAIEAAGGATDAAVISALNLARVVADGEQIVVPDAAGAAAAEAAGNPGEGAAPGAGSPGTGSPGGSALVNLNSASQTALESLPGVGPALAGRIMSWREKNGPFTAVEQLLEVSGIGQKKFDGLRDQVTV